MASEESADGHAVCVPADATVRADESCLEVAGYVTASSCFGKGLGEGR